MKTSNRAPNDKQRIRSCNLCLNKSSKTDKNYHRRIQLFFFFDDVCKHLQGSSLLKAGQFLFTSSAVRVCSQRKTQKDTCVHITVTNVYLCACVNVVQGEFAWTVYELLLHRCITFSSPVILRSSAANFLSTSPLCYPSPIAPSPFLAFFSPIQNSLSQSFPIIPSLSPSPLTLSPSK